MDKHVYRPLPSQSIAQNDLLKSKFSGGKQTSFAAQLQSVVQGTDGLTISKHAQQRLEQRGIIINRSRWDEIEGKVIEAKKMGVNESLVLLNEAALIISAKNHTVITAMDRKEAASQIFTNINGTILMD
jgi:flagellar operon protein